MNPKKFTMAALSVVFCAASSAQYAPGEAVPVALQEPVIRDVLQYDDQLRATVRVLTEAQVVSIKWRWHQPGNPKIRYEVGFQEEKCSFKPTAADFDSEGNLMVAGIDPWTGKTVIERWGIKPPKLADAPKAIPSEPDKIKMPSLSFRHTIINESVVGRRGVRALFCPVQHSSMAYVQFWDSRDLFQVTWGAPGTPTVWTVVVTDENFPGLTSGAYDTYWKGTHDDFGHIYVMGDDQDMCAAGVVYLCDTDKDGTIDTWIKASLRLNEHPEFRDRMKFTNLHGLDV